MSPIRGIMMKLNGRGPNALQTSIGAALKADKPAWETIEPQANEYAQLAADLAKHDPPKGSKESWAKFAADYAGLATTLDKAAQAKDKDAATAAHEDLAASCNDCHRQHRGGPGMGGPGRGGPGRGGPGMGGRPGGGPLRMAPVVLLRVAAALRQMVRLSEPRAYVAPQQYHRSLGGRGRASHRACPGGARRGVTQTLPGHPSHNAG